jgi:cellulase/cellobiase CelA1
MYDMVAQWPGGFEAIVMVMNGAAARTSWSLSWTFADGQTITQIWSGTATQNGAAVTVRNASYNGTLAPNANTQFGFLGSWNGVNSVPTAITCQ